MIQFKGNKPIEEGVLEILLKEIEFDMKEGVYCIEPKPISEGLEIKFQEGNIEIGYDSKSTFIRALAIVKESLLHKQYESIKQIPKFEALGVMLDCSRNAVLKVEAVKKFMRYLALMGYKSLQLYTEDTYELEEYPYFGYMRGSYKKEELKEIVDYSEKLGIEVIPCIQTLAHLGGTLRWKTFYDLTDCDDILLVGEEKTYALIEAMIKHAATYFKSRTINIGMDEAHNLGLGKYLQKHGYKERIQIMIEHLKKVNKICKKYGMRPMMWSDMFFRLLSTTGEYDGNCDLKQNEFIAQLPQDIDIIFWDYYNKNEEHYASILNQHKKLSNETLFAGGAWRWSGIVPNNAFSLCVSEQALNACIKQGIKKIFVTAWGDDGGECATFAILPNLVYYAERCYNETLDDKLFEKRFKTFTGSSLEDFMRLDTANHLPDNPAPGRCAVNPSKYLFFQDPLLGIYDKHVVLGETNAFYEQLAKELEESIARNSKWEYLFSPIYLTAKILSNKAEMGIRLQKAYKEKDKEAIKACIYQLEQVYIDIKAYHIAIRKQWMIENKMSGLEVQDQRIGGMLTRILMIKERLQDYVEGRIEDIEELEYERLRFDGGTEELPPSISSVWWHEIVSPNRIGRT